MANTFWMLHTFGAKSDKGVMSALGKREQILGRAQEREEKAGAPVPRAAGAPQPHGRPGLPSQALATICPRPRYCLGEWSWEGAPTAPSISSVITVRRKHHPSQWLAWHAPSPLPVGAALRHRQTELGVAAALVMMLLVLSTGVQEATSLIKLN